MGHKRMGELLKTIRLVGAGRTWQLFQAYRQGMMGTISGYYNTRTIQALLNVGVFDEMQARGRVNPTEFAKVHNLDADMLKAMCDALFSFRILKKEGDGYALDRKGRVLVGSARGWFEGVYGYEDVFHSLESMLRKEKEYGKDVKRRIEAVTKGYAEMEKQVYFPWLIDIIEKNRFQKVLDLGCGDGTFLRTLCESNPTVTGYGVDIAPEAIADGRKRIEAAGLADRLQLLVADISKLDRVPEPLRGIDVATTFFVLHELLYVGADCVVELLRSFARMFPGVPLVVFEVVKPSPEEMRKRPGMAIHYFLYHDITHQKPVSREEWRELFKKAGFNSIGEVDLWFARSMIFTLR